MRCDLWLAQPNTETHLRAALRIAGTLFAVWALAVAFGLWSMRSAVTRGQTALAARSQQLSTLADNLNGKHRDAAQAALVQTASPEGSGSADFATELNGLAQTAGAEMTGVQMGNNDKAAASQDKNAADWQQEGFECNVQGQYAALTRFLDGLTASRRVLEFRGIQVTPSGAGTGTDAPVLEMKLTGVVSGLAQKP